MGRVEVWTSGDIIAIYGSTMSYGSLQFTAFFSPLIIVPKCYVMLIFLEPIGNGSTPLNILLGNCLACIKSALHLSVFCLLSSLFLMENLLKTFVQFINNLITNHCQIVQNAVNICASVELLQFVLTFALICFWMFLSTRKGKRLHLLLINMTRSNEFARMNINFELNFGPSRRQHQHAQPRHATCWEMK